MLNVHFTINDASFDQPGIHQNFLSNFFQKVGPPGRPPEALRIEGKVVVGGA